MRRSVRMKGRKLDVDKKLRTRVLEEQVEDWKLYN
jgi:hypothetical protein